MLCITNCLLRDDGDHEDNDDKDEDCDENYYGSVV